MSAARLSKYGRSLRSHLRTGMQPLCFCVTCPHVAERSSPLSLKVIFEQVKRGGGMSLQKCLDDEFSVNTHLFSLPDFEMAMQAREPGVSLKTVANQMNYQHSPRSRCAHLSHVVMVT